MRAFLFMISLIALLLVAAAVGIELMSADPAVASQLDRARRMVGVIGMQGWEFVRPLLQLIIVFLILDWLFGRLGLRFKLEQFKGSANVQTFIACIVIATFCIAVLAGLTDGLSYLKDVVLIVIGFYFGTRARPEELTASGHESAGSSPYSADSPAGTAPGKK